MTIAIKSKLTIYRESPRTIFYFVVFIFSPLSSNPVYSKSEICDSDVIAAVYLPREKESANDDVDDLWQTKSQLYFMNRNQRLLTLSQETRAESEETVKVHFHLI